MSADDTQENAQLAAEQAKQAGNQTKAAAKSAGRAAKAAAEPAVEKARDTVEDVVDAAADAGEETVRLVQKGTGEVAEFAVDEFKQVRDTARKVDVGVLSRISSDTGIGFLALSVSIYSGAIAYAKFRQALSGRGQVLKP